MNFPGARSLWRGRNRGLDNGRVRGRDRFAPRLGTPRTGRVGVAVAERDDLVECVFVVLLESRSDTDWPCTIVGQMGCPQADVLRVREGSRAAGQTAPSRMSANWRPANVSSWHSAVCRKRSLDHGRPGEQLRVAPSTGKKVSSVLITPESLRRCFGSTAGLLVFNTCPTHEIVPQLS